MARYADTLSPTRRAYWQRERPIELRPCDPDRYFQREPGIAAQHVWVRVKNPLPDDPDLHRVLLAYISDMTLLDGAMLAHGKSVVDPDVQSWSLDHALWFHEPLRTDQWLLYAQDSPWSGHARGMGRGLLFSEDGRLVASVIQEGLVRPRSSELLKK
jgi:acyl-CoA thioesterase-2